MCRMAAVARGRPRSFDRDAVLDKVVRLFWQHGYEATSMRELVGEVGVAAPSLYRAFGDKEHLFAEAVEVCTRQHGDLIDRAFTEESTACAGVARILDETPGRYTAGLPTGCLIPGRDGIPCVGHRGRRCRREVQQNDGVMDALDCYQVIAALGTGLWG